MYPKENDDMTVIQKMLSKQNWKESYLMVELRKYACGDVDSPELQQGMKSDLEFSNSMQNKLLLKKLIVASLRHVITGVKSERKISLKKLLR